MRMLKLAIAGIAVVMSISGCTQQKTESKPPPMRWEPRL